MRKPFIDRSVNETPFQKNKTYREKQGLFNADKIQANKIISPQKKYPDWLLDICSYKDVFDDCWDIQYSPNMALREGLNSYFRPQTPPPLLKCVNTIFELPSFEPLSPESPIGCYRMEEIEEPELPMVEIDF